MHVSVSRGPALGAIMGLALLTVPALPGSAQMSTTVVTPGTSNPWLAGMPAGSTASGGDTAPAQSPAQVIGLLFGAGDTFTFAATGSVNYGGGTPTDPPDGNVNYLTGHGSGAENGISNVTMPVDALLGVFIGPGQPNANVAPSALDFSTAASQNYLTLHPLVQQVFYIGDGLTSGGTIQNVIAPSGATRLYLGMMDGSGWYNNTGSFRVIVTDLNLSSAPVPEASTTVSFGLLLALGLGGLVIAARRKKTGAKASA